MSTPPAQGSLEDVPLPRLFVDLYRARFTGALQLTRGKTEKRLLFHQGAPLHVDSNVVGEGLAAQLSRTGTITPEQANEVEELVKRKRCAEGAALLSLRLLEPKALFAALKDQLRRRIVECFGWPGGRFQLETDVVPPDEAQPFRTDPYALIQEGLATHWSVERLLGDLVGQLDRYPRPARVFSELARRLIDSPEVKRLIQAVDGSRSLGQALGSGGNSPQVLAAVWLMDATQALLYESEPIRRTDDSEAELQEIEIEVIGAASTRSDRETQTTASAEQSASDNPEAEKMRQEVLDQHARLSELTHYELLDLSADCKPAAIKKAYFSAAKRHHPDALNRLGLGDLKTQASEVFSRISQAYEVLKNAQKRKDYDASLLDDGPEIDASRLAQAETFYRKGDILARMGDFRGALQFFQNAVDVWPEESVYQCDLGWAFFRKSPPEQDAARTHLEQAIELQSDNAAAHYRLGLVLRNLGEEKEAEEHIDRAKEIDPSIS